VSGTVFKTDQRLFGSLVRSTRTVFRQQSMRTKLFLLIAGGALLLGIIAYRFYTSTNDLNVTPQAAKEIEKAKKR
jgi:hypothetical protein